MNGSPHEAPRFAHSVRAPTWDRGAFVAKKLVRSPYPRLVGRAALGVAQVQVAAWDFALRRVRATQESTLLSLLKLNEETEFGRAHSFSRIRDYAGFARAVPVGDYDSFSPFIDRMRAGESNVLVPEFVQHFGNSSGSSNHGKSKFLPITDRQVRFQQRAGTDAVMRYLHWSGD
ncbi:MAG TPA: GH3 auxin-responsive promoter family protein, partial [Candidatus Tumulicola sp.]|nr:GH3 auxin-responsive promoter family protein [Candidatus Tumulicola sp.]